MRMSCNGCRVLRKGCSDNCSIRPCLEWIKSPESQANATVFLAKFYGRAGLMNLINAGPSHLRPGIFRSLLYEACGRIVNPIYGSVGLMWSGSWQLCHSAVEAVLRGAPVTRMDTDAPEAKTGPPYDIRHVNKDNLTNPRRVRNKRSGKRARLSEEVNGSISHESSLSHQSQQSLDASAGEGEIELDLTLGFEPIRTPKRAESGFSEMELRLDCLPS
ncbi:hypothetical protein SASPL_141382 [Salvia splendens]|uniref:LOB domain-containing protein n=1 Tax=Salvia splendens TaxID=180675 RepID=A0A8X8ZC98_SALSN|nr:LOB domain-containing protein 41-like [Salvia splendens]KAG6399897.1 hypothetical protein SASPL_141382 [Salvia splendens]